MYTSVHNCAAKACLERYFHQKLKKFYRQKGMASSRHFSFVEGRSQSATPPIERIWKLFHSDTYWQNIETEPMATSAEIKQLCFLSNSNTKINTYDFKKSMLNWTLQKEIWIIQVHYNMYNVGK